MRFERDDLMATFKALPIFSTLRSNLAMVDGFLRRSTIEKRNHKSENLGFLGVRTSEKQMRTHNWSITFIIVALLYQTLKNYFDLKKICLRLEDPSLEGFLNGLENTDQFVNGMRTIRNGVFHIKSPKSWRSRNVNSFAEACKQRGGILVVMTKLRKLLYDFTEKVFLGELRIWPESIYEDQDRLKRERPDLIEKLETGEVDILEVIETMNSLQEGSEPKN